MARGKSFLERKGLDSPRLETELLVAHALGTDRLHVFLELDRPVDPEEIVRAREYLVRRASGEPCAYITGLREFYARDFAVGKGVLVPRPETELLVDLGRERLEGKSSPRILDVGTGSGCLAVTFALEVDEAVVTATDISEEALAFARRNAETLQAQVHFHHGDGVEPVRGAEFDLIVSNPPYVDPDLPGDASNPLEPGVRLHEPAEALFSPSGDPDHWAHRLIAERSLLARDGTLLVELGFDQAERLSQHLSQQGLAHRVHEDLAGVPRVLEVPR